ncbi:MAG: DUF4328 domain-containing protein [Pseudomonadota bacterium]
MVEADSQRIRALASYYGPLRISLWLYLIMNALLATLILIEYITLTQYGFDPYLADGAPWLLFALASVIVGIGLFSVTVVAYIIGGFWIVRAMGNLHRIGSRFVTTSPAWAVGWYFIPIANLWKPYEAMSQIWEGSHRAANEETPDQSPLPLWWALWIISAIVGNIGTQLGGWLGQGPNFEASLIFSAASALLTVGVTLMFLKITTRTTQLQGRIAAQSATPMDPAGHQTGLSSELSDIEKSVTKDSPTNAQPKAQRQIGKPLSRKI